MDTPTSPGRKRGPKARETDGGDLEPLNVMVDKMTRRRLAVICPNNLSQAVRTAARVAYDHYQRGKL